MRTAPVPGVAAIAVVGVDRGAGKATAPARRSECAGGSVSQADLPRASAAHRADIQGLRAVAVLIVVVAHAGVRFVAGGFVGVDVFFVLSGFLITGLLLGEARAHGSVSLVDFYVRRARRILPAAALTLVATDAAAFFLLSFVRARDAIVDSLNDIDSFSDSIVPVKAELDGPPARDPIVDPDQLNSGNDVLINAAVQTATGRRLATCSLLDIPRRSWRQRVAPATCLPDLVAAAARAPPPR